MKYVVTIPEIVLLVVTIVTLALFVSIYPIKVPWKPVFANPDAQAFYPSGFNLLGSTHVIAIRVDQFPNNYYAETEAESISYWSD
jgi:hypothetical protein